MIPPIDHAVLEANPQFALLHKALTTKLLNPDASTKDHPTQRERDARAQELRERQLEAAKTRLMKSALVNMPLTETKRSVRPPWNSNGQPATSVETTLDPELSELIQLLTLQLTTKLSFNQIELLQNSHAYAQLPNYMERIATLISSYLVSQALPLTRLLHHTTNSSFLHRSIPNLPLASTTLRQNIAVQRAEILKSRLGITPLAMKTLHAYVQCSEACIRVLETTKHGALARHSNWSSAYAKLQAQSLALEAEQKTAQARGVVYTKEVRRALRTYGEHLRDGRARLSMRGRDAKGVLEGYGVRDDDDEEDADGGRKERTMREIAKVWGEMESQVEAVRKDIDRLNGRG